MASLQAFCFREDAASVAVEDRPRWTKRFTTMQLKRICGSVRKRSEAAPMAHDASLLNEPKEQSWDLTGEKEQSGDLTVEKAFPFPRSRPQPKCDNCVNTTTSGPFSETTTVEDSPLDASTTTTSSGSRVKMAGSSLYGPPGSQDSPLDASTTTASSLPRVKMAGSSLYGPPGSQAYVDIVNALAPRPTTSTTSSTSRTTVVGSTSPVANGSVDEGSHRTIPLELVLPLLGAMAKNLSSTPSTNVSAGEPPQPCSDSVQDFPCPVSNTTSTVFVPPCPCSTSSKGQQRTPASAPTQAHQGGGVEINVNGVSLEFSPVASPRGPPITVKPRETPKAPPSAVAPLAVAAAVPFAQELPPPSAAQGGALGLPQGAWKLNRLGAGCRNWHDIRFGEVAREATVAACAARCLGSNACVGFGYQNEKQCTPASAMRPGTCFLWHGPCILEDNACWDDYTLNLGPEQIQRRNDAWLRRVHVCGASTGPSRWKDESVSGFKWSIEPPITLPYPPRTVYPEDKPVCFFVNSFWSNRHYRERTIAVASTWGRPEYIPQHARLYYLVGASSLDPLPSDEASTLIRNDQLVVFSSDLDPVNLSLRERMRSTIVTLYSRFKGLCSWFVDVDDDSYINMTLIVEKLRCIDAGQPRYIGPVYMSPLGPFVHGSLKIFTDSGLGIMRDAMRRCAMPCSGYDDVHLAECLRIYQRTGPDVPQAVKALAPQKFGRVSYNNRRCDQETDDCMNAAMDLVTKSTLPECLDVVHKVVGLKAMKTVHDFLQLTRDVCPYTTEQLLAAVEPSLVGSSLGHCLAPRSWACSKPCPRECPEPCPCPCPVGDLDPGPDAGLDLNLLPDLMPPRAQWGRHDHTRRRRQRR
eukprot:TRINITY_DN7285_c0_g1_i3.p1 TRINITY_DN7285_c0_g1~~TRINITY_DN7285_c0_g1_i3.p1  ORF type:complete len:993 (-),score=103.26 TRINITY_DN7285_c0_g1_i3:56-2644(-)